MFLFFIFFFVFVFSSNINIDISDANPTEEELEIYEKLQSLNRKIDRLAFYDLQETRDEKNLKSNIGTCWTQKLYEYTPLHQYCHLEIYQIAVKTLGYPSSYVRIDQEGKCKVQTKFTSSCINF